MRSFFRLALAAGVIGVVMLAAGAFRLGAASAQTAPPSGVCTVDPTNGALLCPPGTPPSQWGVGTSAQTCYTDPFGTTYCWNGYSYSPVNSQPQATQNCYVAASGVTYCNYGSGYVPVASQPAAPSNPVCTTDIYGNMFCQTS